MDKFKALCALTFHITGTVALAYILWVLCAYLWSELGLNEQAEKAIERQCECVCAEEVEDE